MEKGDNHMTRYCCECRADVTNKPIGITVCDRCKAMRRRQGHALMWNPPLIKNRQGRKKTVWGRAEVG